MLSVLQICGPALSGFQQLSRGSQLPPAYRAASPSPARCQSATLSRRPLTCSLSTTRCVPSGAGDILFDVIEAVAAVRHHEQPFNLQIARDVHSCQLCVSDCSHTARRALDQHSACSIEYACGCRTCCEAWCQTPSLHDWGCRHLTAQDSAALWSLMRQWMRSTASDWRR